MGLSGLDILESSSWVVFGSKKLFKSYNKSMETIFTPFALSFLASSIAPDLLSNGGWEVSKTMALAAFGCSSAVLKT